MNLGVANFDRWLVKIDVTVNVDTLRRMIEVMPRYWFGWIAKK